MPCCFLPFCIDGFPICRFICDVCYGDRRRDVQYRSERLADLSSSHYSHLARIAKDVAAGGVLVCALFAIAVGVCLFWQPAAFVRMWKYFMDRPYMAVLLMLSLIVALVYVVLGPVGIRNVFRRKKKLPATLGKKGQDM